MKTVLVPMMLLFPILTNRVIGETTNDMAVEVMQAASGKDQEVVVRFSHSLSGQAFVAVSTLRGVQIQSFGGQRGGVATFNAGDASCARRVSVTAISSDGRIIATKEISLEGAEASPWTIVLPVLVGAICTAIGGILATIVSQLNAQLLFERHLESLGRDFRQAVDAGVRSSFKIPSNCEIPRCLVGGKERSIMKFLDKLRRLEREWSLQGDRLRIIQEIDAGWRSD